MLTPASATRLVQLSDPPGPPVPGVQLSNRRSERSESRQGAQGGADLRWAVDKPARSTMVLQVPRKLRQLIADLESEGFFRVPTKSSHRKYRHAGGTTVILSGQTGADAHHYQEKEVRRAIAAAKTSTNS